MQRERGGHNTNRRGRCADRHGVGIDPVDMAGEPTAVPVLAYAVDHHQLERLDPRPLLEQRPEVAVEPVLAVLLERNQPGHGLPAVREALALLVAPDELLTAPAPGQLVMRPQPAELALRHPGTQTKHIPPGVLCELVC